MDEKPCGILSQIEEAAIQVHIRLEESGDGLSFLNIFKAGAEWMAGQGWISVDERLPEMDLEKELYDYICSGEYLNTRGNGSLLIARHFYGLRNRALEEAARHVFESWMGGTMDDVRRDMVELGTVLNARKEE